MIVSTKQLTKRYGSTVALNSVGLAVPANSVYGMVGPNGSGKTTLLSILAGLRRPTSGTTHIEVDRHDWAMCPDTPAFEPWLTAKEVLRLAGTLAGTPPSEERVDTLLSEAGLADAARRRVGGFSRGMTQRLAIAATIVTQPQLVILDEPCSALDPAGRVEVLDLVRRAGEQATVIFSSHVLADIQRVCDTVGVLAAGEMIFQGGLHELLDRYARPVWRLTVRENASAVATALEEMPWATKVTVIDANTARLEAASTETVEREIAGVLARTGVSLASFEPEAADLETVFLELTKR